MFDFPAVIPYPARPPGPRNQHAGRGLGVAGHAGHAPAVAGCLAQGPEGPPHLVEEGPVGTRPESTQKVMEGLQLIICNA